MNSFTLNLKLQRIISDFWNVQCSRRKGQPLKALWFQCQCFSVFSCFVWLPGISFACTRFNVTYVGLRITALVHMGRALLPTRFLSLTQLSRARWRHETLSTFNERKSDFASRCFPRTSLATAFPLAGQNVGNSFQYFPLSTAECMGLFQHISTETSTRKNLPLLK